jgi:hypothetical protein
MQDLGSIMDTNVDNADELEQLHDIRNDYDDLAYARDLDRPEDEEPAVPATESGAAAPREEE